MNRILTLALVLAFVLVGCEQQDSLPTAAELDAERGAFMESEDALSKNGGGDTEAYFAAQLDEINAALAAQGADTRVLMAEWIGSPDGGEAGGTVFAKDVGNKQLSADFVPFDSRRAPWSGSTSATDDITYAIDQTADAVPFFGGLTAAQTTAAIVRGHATWENLNCSTLPQTAVSDGGFDLGYVAALFGLGGSFAVAADIQHAGFRDINFAGGVLGVTFTLVWTSGGVPTDIDNNGKADVAFREIYYDPSWNWADDGVTNIDLESVAVHEVGHGLSQAHFGKVWLKNDGSLKASPRAVMNALYAAPYRSLAGTDNGGHCSNWANWPNN